MKQRSAMLAQQSAQESPPRHFRVVLGWLGRLADFDALRVVITVFNTGFRHSLIVARMTFGEAGVLAGRDARIGKYGSPNDWIGGDQGTDDAGGHRADRAIELYARGLRV